MKCSSLAWIEDFWARKALLRLFVQLINKRLNKYTQQCLKDRSLKLANGWAFRIRTDIFIIHKTYIKHTLLHSIIKVYLLASIIVKRKGPEKGLSFHWTLLNCHFYLTSTPNNFGRQSHLRQLPMLCNKKTQTPFRLYSLFALFRHYQLLKSNTNPSVKVPFFNWKKKL